MTYFYWHIYKYRIIYITYKLVYIFYIYIYTPAHNFIRNVSASSAYQFDCLGHVT